MNCPYVTQFLFGSKQISWFLKHSDAFVYTGKYCEFHSVYQEKNYKEAAQLLMALLASRITPK